MSPPDRSKLSSWVKLLRPTQWVKNGFVLAPLLFSHSYVDPRLFGKGLIAVVAFCLVSSAVYALNDICDRREDQAHPDKRTRPLACGDLSVWQAVFSVVLMTFVALLIGGLLGWKFEVVLSCYLLLNVLYSLRGKHLPILDVMFIATGFVLRVLAGAVAISVPTSHWLLLCTLMISMFLGFTKRRAEMTAFESTGEAGRTVLKHYSVAFLDQAIAMMTAVTLMCYALYTVDDRTVDYFGSRAMLITVPSVMYGLFRYVYIIYRLDKGKDPTATLARDWPSMVNLATWILLVALVIRFGRHWGDWI
jgi:4-hydroxybenzoate polyprenyltransferase